MRCVVGLGGVGCSAKETVASLDAIIVDWLSTDLGCDFDQ